jgi:hypothetical protein
MFIEQRPQNSKQQVMKVVMTPEEAEAVWSALANSVHRGPTADKLRDLLWREINRPRPMGVWGRDNAA